MADGIVAARALQTCRLAVRDVAIDRRGDRLMAPAAGVLGDLVIELCNLDGVGIPAAGEVKRMPESVVRLHCIFADDVVRCVAIVAGRGRVVTRLHPRVVLLLHDVAIRASRGIVR